MTGYKAYLKYAEGVTEKPELGLQERTIGVSRIFVVPNPSPANAQYSLDDLVYWYQRLADYRQEPKGAGTKAVTARQEKVRVFVALDLPSKAKSALAETVDRLKRLDLRLLCPPAYAG